MAHIYLASPHMSEEGYEQQYVKEAFDTNWIAPLGKNVNEFEKEYKTEFLSYMDPEWQALQLFIWH